MGNFFHVWTLDIDMDHWTICASLCSPGAADKLSADWNNKPVWLLDGYLLSQTAGLQNQNGAKTTPGQIYDPSMMEIQLQQPQTVHLHFILIYQEKRIVVTF